MIDGTFGVYEAPPGIFLARGSGDEYAKGAAYALRRRDETHGRVIVEEAIRAACAHNSGCGGEPFVMKLGAG